MDRKNEPLRDYIRRFSDMRLKIPKISHDEAISAFIKGLCFHKALRSKLLHKRPTTVAELLATAKNYADADDAEKLIREDVRGTEQPPRRDDSHGRFDNQISHRGDNRDHREGWDKLCDNCDNFRGKRPRDNDHEVNKVKRRDYQEDYNKTLKGPCQLEPKSNHTMEECHVLKSIYTQWAAQGDAAKKNGNQDRRSEEDEDDDQDRDPWHQYVSPTDVVHSIFGGKVSIESKRERKLLKRACLNVDSTYGSIADPKIPPWSHREISFNGQDQWAAIPEPGRFPLILDPCINSVRFERVLVDGGSSIDILFRNSLPALKLTPTQLNPYDAQFWGILPGQSLVPLGQITLPVQFGMPDHFRTEFVNFVVADFDGTYHAFLGRPSLTKFMAVPHYSYLVLKMRIEKGVLTVRGNIYTAYTCEEESFKITEAIDLSICMAETVAQATQTSPDQLKLPEQETPRKSTKSKEHKEVQLVDGSLEKMALIGANLDAK